MLAVERIEFGVVNRSVFRAVPPIPIAAFGREKRFLRSRQPRHGLGRSESRAFERLSIFHARFAEQFPCANILRVSNPDIEIRADPRPRENPFHNRLAGVSWMASLTVRGRISGSSSILLIKFSQEIPAVARVVFPRVFAVEDYAHRCGSAGRLTISDCANPPVQVIRRNIRAHPAVNKSNQIRQIMVAEETAHFPFAAFETPRRVQLGSIIRIAGGIAPEAEVSRPTQHSFIRREPLESQLHGDFESLVGDGPFRRPQAHGRLAEYALVEFARAMQLFSRVLGMTESRVRQRRVGIRDARNIGVAKQRKNRMVVRRR